MLLVFGFEVLGFATPLSGPEAAMRQCMFAGPFLGTSLLLGSRDSNREFFISSLIDVHFIRLAIIAEFKKNNDFSFLPLSFDHTTRSDFVRVPHFLSCSTL